MGYTHYFETVRDLTPDEWTRLSADVATILQTVEHRAEVRLCDGAGKRGSKPIFGPNYIQFNGSGDDAHETFTISRTDESDFCKTNRKPYDLAVTAVLSYMCVFHLLGDEASPVAFEARSDGTGKDFLAGVETARVALPHFGNILDIPMGVMQSDRWCGPWVDDTKKYEFNFCVDGHAYVTERKRGGQTFRFHNHKLAAEWASSFTEKPIRVNGWGGNRMEGGKGLFRASGSFNEQRHAALERQRNAAFKPLFNSLGAEELARWGTLGEQPPAYVRPDYMPPVAVKPNAYYLDDLLKEMAPAA